MGGLLLVLAGLYLLAYVLWAIRLFRVRECYKCGKVEDIRAYYIHWVCKLCDRRKQDDATD